MGYAMFHQDERVSLDRLERHNYYTNVITRLLGQNVST